MSDYSIDITEFLKKSLSLPVMDVRSPLEFEHAHIPGAINLPLFTNEERSVIGTLYLKKGSSEAMIRGLEFIGPKMASFVATGKKIAPGGEALMHCWRGGMRSSSMAWLMNTIGIKTYTLTGGYKSYRRQVLSFFSQPMNLIVIGGMTGSGKTGVINALESKGAQVIHLERLARHKGSVFGGIGMPEQPSTEQFENDLFHHLNQLDLRKPVYIEDESMAIGNVFLPRALYERMSESRFVCLTVPTERRISSLVDDYTKGSNETLISAVKKIERRLGLEHARNIVACIANGQMAEAVALILKYYDKVYTRSMSQHKRTESKEIHAINETFDEIADRILEAY